MAGNSKRTIIQLESTAGTGYTYTVSKSKNRHPGRIEFRKFDPILAKISKQIIKKGRNCINLVITTDPII